MPLTLPEGPGCSSPAGQPALGVQPSGQLLGGRHAGETAAEDHVRWVGVDGGPGVVDPSSAWSLRSITASFSLRDGGLEPISGPDHADDDADRQDQGPQGEPEGRDGNPGPDDQGRNAGAGIRSS